MLGKPCAEILPKGRVLSKAHACPPKPRAELSRSRGREMQHDWAVVGNVERLNNALEDVAAEGGREVDAVNSGGKAAARG